MNNVFKNAYFGKAYKTSDGRKVVLVSIFPDDGKAYLMSEYKIRNNCFGNDAHIYRLDGIHRDCPELDIVSEWQEEINEEELEKLAEEEYPYEDGIEEAHWNANQHRLRQAFKAGYHKAKEE